MVQHQGEACCLRPAVDTAGAGDPAASVSARPTRLAGRLPSQASRSVLLPPATAPFLCRSLEFRTVLRAVLTL